MRFFRDSANERDLRPTNILSAGCCGPSLSACQRYTSGRHEHHDKCLCDAIYQQTVLDCLCNANALAARHMHLKFLLFCPNTAMQWASTFGWLPALLQLHCVQAIRSRLGHPAPPDLTAAVPAQDGSSEAEHVPTQAAAAATPEGAPQTGDADEAAPPPRPPPPAVSTAPKVTAPRMVLDDDEEELAALDTPPALGLGGAAAAAAGLSSAAKDSGVDTAALMAADSGRQGQGGGQQPAQAGTDGGSGRVLLVGEARDALVAVVEHLVLNYEVGGV
jgi:hypothetical protein